MYITNENYKNAMETFLNEKNGSIVKLLDDNHNIIGYILRCEADSKKNVVFSLNFNFGYPTIKSIKEKKYCMLSRILNKWKKSQEVFKFNDIKHNKDFETNLKNEIKDIVLFLNNNDYNVNEEQFYKYVLKNIYNIENYYKTDDFNLILI